MSTGKFFTHDAYETPRRAVYFTNYRLFRDERIETAAGSIQSVASVGSLGAVTCEVIERLQKIPGGPFSGEIIATGGETLINDFAAVISFALSITCTPDPDLTRRLTSPDKPSLGTNLIPQKFIPRMFDATVPWQQTDGEVLKQFVADLMALERKHYEGAIRAIRRFVVGAHRVSDDVNLAYSLFVMSVESLAQDFDAFQATWDDLDQTKRRRLDSALQNAEKSTIDDVRAAILATEHMALSRRFREFALSHIEPTFFRGEALNAEAAISRPDLSSALRQAYSIRSQYVHHLNDIPVQIVAYPGFHETITVDERPTLTFAGLVRVAHHVIRSFVARSPKTDREKYDWMSDLPGRITMPLASQHWVHNPKPFNVNNARRYLEAFMGQIVDAHLQQPATLSDMRPVLAKAEELLPGLAKPAQRLPLLVLHFIFNFHAPDGTRSASHPALIQKYEADLEPPSVESLAAHLATGQNPDWTLAEMEKLHALYFTQRQHADKLRLGSLLEAAFTLRLAEMHRVQGDAASAREFIALAVEIRPQHQGLLQYEKEASSSEPSQKMWQDILFPGSYPAVDDPR